MPLRTLCCREAPHEFVEGKVQQNAAHDQRQIGHVEVGVKPQRHAQQIGRGQARIAPVQQEIACHTQWQEQKHEYVRIKQQSAYASQSIASRGKKNQKGRAAQKARAASRGKQSKIGLEFRGCYMLSCA